MNLSLGSDGSTASASNSLAASASNTGGNIGGKGVLGTSKMKGRGWSKWQSIDRIDVVAGTDSSEATGMLLGMGMSMGRGIIASVVHHIVHHHWHR